MGAARQAFISDIHGNYPALLQVLETIEQRSISEIYCAGDVVGKGPYPAEVIRLLRQRGIPAIQGNADQKALRLHGKSRKKLEKKLADGGGHIVWSVLQLGQGEWSWLESLPEELWIERAGYTIQVVHGNPRSSREYIFPSVTEQALFETMGRVPDLLVCGHSHIPFFKSLGGVAVLNCGSAGLPVDGDFRVSYAVVELDDTGIRPEIVRVEYPADIVAADMERLQVPGLEPRSFLEGRKVKKQR